MLTRLACFVQQVLEGQRVLPKKAQDLGFRFKYPEISGALRAIVAS